MAALTGSAGVRDGSRAQGLSVEERNARGRNLAVAPAGDVVCSLHYLEASSEIKGG